MTDTVSSVVTRKASLAVRTQTAFPRLSSGSGMSFREQSPLCTLGSCQGSQRGSVCLRVWNRLMGPSEPMGWTGRSWPDSDSTASWADSGTPKSGWIDPSCGASPHITPWKVWWDWAGEFSHLCKIAAATTTPGAELGEEEAPGTTAHIQPG